MNTLLLLAFGKGIIMNKLIEKEEKNINPIENYDSGIIFVIGYLSYTGCIELLNTSKLLRMYKSIACMFK